MLFKCTLVCGQVMSRFVVLDGIITSFQASWSGNISSHSSLVLGYVILCRAVLCRALVARVSDFAISYSNGLQLRGSL